MQAFYQKKYGFSTLREEPVSGKLEQFISNTSLNDFPLAQKNVTNKNKIRISYTIKTQSGCRF